MKTCTKCKIPKELSEFHKSKLGKYERQSSCKFCVCENKRKYDSQEHIKAHQKAYRKTAAWKDIHSRSQKKSDNKFPNAHKARYTALNAIRSGKITRPSTCSECSIKCKSNAHHDDYDKPLDVRWLCTKCHTAWHRHNTPLNRI